MKLRRVAYLVTTLAAFGAGCTLLYDAGDFTVGGPKDATVAAETSTDASLSVDPCEHVSPPARPVGNDAPSASQPKLTFALSHLALVAGNRDSLGFDLDGVCTCDTRPGTAKGGASSCVPRKPEQVLCDGPGGRDNGAAALFSRIVSNKPDSSVDVGFDISAREGVESLLIELDEYDGTGTDPEVFVALIDTPGLDPPSDCDAGAPRGDGGVNGSGEPRPAWDGCDAWQLGQNSLLGDNPRTFTRQAWVTGRPATQRDHASASPHERGHLRSCPRRRSRTGLRRAKDRREALLPRHGHLHALPLGGVRHLGPLRLRRCPSSVRLHVLLGRARGRARASRSESPERGHRLGMCRRWIGDRLPLSA
jgi:hypothetical protein